MLTSILFWTLIAIVSTAVVWKGSGWLESSAEQLSAYYHLPAIVQGAVVVAVGSSFPELSTTVISTLVHGQFELGVAAIVGSALFNILVIPAAASWVGKQQLQSNRDLVYKEAQFYMIAVAVLLLTFSFAVIYAPVESDQGTILGELNRWLALIPLVLYSLYLFVQYQDTMDYEAEIDVSDIQPLQQWGLLAASLLVIVAGVEGLIRAAINFGEIFGTPSFLWGITIVAAGTSLPDAFVSIRAARNGKAITSLANVLGSNIFDLLVAIPAGVLVAGTAVVNYSVAAPMMGMLTLATIVLFLLMRTQMTLTPSEGIVLLVLYCLFVLWISLESFAVIDWVPGLPPRNAATP